MLQVPVSLNTYMYKEGDAVWYFCPQTGQGHCRKLTPKWQGPFIITEKLNDILYRIQEKPGKKIKIVHYKNKLCIREIILQPGLGIESNKYKTVRLDRTK